MNGIWSWFLLIASVLLVLALFQQQDRASQIFSGWAEENGYRIVQIQYRRFFTGPYFRVRNGRQTICRITVEDKYKVLHHGWIRYVGSLRDISLSDAVEVKWDSST